jgi:hypothetical protein
MTQMEETFNALLREAPALTDWAVACCGKPEPRITGYFDRGSEANGQRFVLFRRTFPRLFIEHSVEHSVNVYALDVQGSEIMLARLDGPPAFSDLDGQSVANFLEQCGCRNITGTFYSMLLQRIQNDGWKTCQDASGVVSLRPPALGVQFGGARP